MVIIKLGYSVQSINDSIIIINYSIDHMLKKMIQTLYISVIKRISFYTMEEASTSGWNYSSPKPSEGWNNTLIIIIVPIVG